jgi:hypothetical protein
MASLLYVNCAGGGGSGIIQIKSRRSSVSPTNTTSNHRERNRKECQCIITSDVVVSPYMRQEVTFNLDTDHNVDPISFSWGSDSTLQVYVQAGQGLDSKQ